MPPTRITRPTKLMRMMRLVRRAGASFCSHHRLVATPGGMGRLSSASACSATFARSAVSTPATIGHKPRLRGGGSALLEPVADPVEGFDGVETVVDRLELLAQSLDVAVDRAVIDIDLVVIGRIHQGIAALHDPRALRQ